jgi:two-component system, sensor histidine kinase and response regulator
MAEPDASIDQPCLDGDNGHFASARLHQQVQQLQQEKADLEILLDATTQHAAAIESELEKAEIELRRALEQERALNQRIEELATLEERNRIARDIHDSLGHLLVGLNVQMETAIALWQDNPERAYKFLTKAKQLGSDALQATRESVSGLRIDPLQGCSLKAAIEHLAQEFYRTTGIQPICQIHLPHPLSSRISTVIYRIVQEGLTNICKHAHPSIVTLHIRCTDTRLLLSLQDNGDGFQLDANRSGFGLQGMQERITALQGTLEIASELGKGCCISASLPLEFKITEPKDF